MCFFKVALGSDHFLNEFLFYFCRLFRHHWIVETECVYAFIFKLPNEYLYSKNSSFVQPASLADDASPTIEQAGHLILQKLIRIGKKSSQISVFVAVVNGLEQPWLDCSSNRWKTLFVLHLMVISCNCDACFYQPAKLRDRNESIFMDSNIDACSVLLLECIVIEVSEKINGIENEKIVVA